MIKIILKQDAQSYEKIYNFRTAFSLGRDDGEYSNMYAYKYCTYDCLDNEILVVTSNKKEHYYDQMKMIYFISENHLTFEGLQDDII